MIRQTISLLSNVNVIKHFFESYILRRSAVAELVKLTMG